MAEWKDILLLGDSIGQGYWDQSMAGWFDRMMAKVGENYPYKFGAHNCAMSGDTSLDVYHRLCSEAASRRPDYLVIAVGINDLVRFKKNPEQTWLSTEKSHECWEWILDHATKMYEKVLVVGLTAVIEERMPPEDEDFQYNSDAIKYNQMLINFCKSYSIPYCDVFDVLKDKPELFRDSTHPNTEGHIELANTVFPKLEELKWLN